MEGALKYWQRLSDQHYVGIAALPEAVYICEKDDTGIGSHWGGLAVECTIPALQHVLAFEDHLAPTVENAHNKVFDIQTFDHENIIVVISVRCESIGNIKGIVRADKDGIIDGIAATKVTHYGQHDLEMSCVCVLVVEIRSLIGAPIAGLPPPVNNNTFRSVEEFHQRAEL